MNHYMRLRPLGFGMSLGILWALSVAVISLLSIYLSYGTAIVTFLTTVYLGYELTLVGVLIGTGWAFLDGFVGGFLLAAVYNLFVRR